MKFDYVSFIKSDVHPTCYKNKIEFSKFILHQKDCEKVNSFTSEFHLQLLTASFPPGDEHPLWGDSISSVYFRIEGNVYKAKGITESVFLFLGDPQNGRMIPEHANINIRLSDINTANIAKNEGHTKHIL